MMLRMLQAALATAILAAACLGDEPSAKAPPVLAGAYYYPWYYKERWTNEPVTHTPQLGWYASSDREAAARHIQWAKQADLDFFMVSWITPKGREDDNLRQTLLPELDNSGFRFALLYDTALSLNLPAGKPLDFDAKVNNTVRAGDRFVEHFDYLADTYLNKKTYLRFQGKAVVNLYLVRDMLNAGPDIERVRKRLSERGIELYLIADVVYWANPESLDWTFLQKNFQAITAYNMYYQPNFVPRVAEQFQASARLARSHGLSFIPNVMPGYDDTPLRGTERVTINRRRGDFYRSFWDAASPFVTPDQPLVLITSFNEWHEGTELEPSTEFGDQYLKLTRELIGKKRAEMASVKNGPQQ